MQTLSNIAGSSPRHIYISKSADSNGNSIGNGVFASRNFDGGEELVGLRRPIVGSLDSQYLEDTCANCYVWAEGAKTGTRLYVPEDTKVQKCAACKRFAYCSKVRAQFWLI